MINSTTPPTTDPRRNTRNVRTGTVTTARPTRIPTRTRTARIRTRMAAVASIAKSPPGRIRYVPRPECFRNHFDGDSLKPASVRMRMCVCMCVCISIVFCVVCGAVLLWRNQSCRIRIRIGSLQERRSRFERFLVHIFHAAVEQPVEETRFIMVFSSLFSSYLICTESCNNHVEHELKLFPWTSFSPINKLPLNANLHVIVIILWRPFDLPFINSFLIVNLFSRSIINGNSL